MTCDQIQPLLDAFAAHDLGWGTAWRVCRHLAACPACTAELAEIHRLDSRVRAWRDAPAPAGLQSRIAAALPSAPPVSAPRRRPATARRVAVGLVGMAAAGAAFFWLTPGQPGRPTIAYADVERAMQNVQTASWRIEETSDRPDHKPGNTRLTFTSWVRRDPPAIATTDFEMTPPHGFNLIKSLTDIRGAFTLSKGECDVNPMLEISAQQRVEMQIHGLTQFPQATPSSEFWGQAKTTTTNFQQRYATVNGQSQIRFDRDVKTVWKMSERHTEYRVAHVVTWADPESHRIIRIEAYISEDTTGVRPFLTMTQDHFRYNQTPPRGTFDWTPPAGVKVVRMPAQAVKK